MRYITLFFLFIIFSLNVYGQQFRIGPNVGIGVNQLINSNDKDGSPHFIQQNTILSSTFGAVFSYQTEWLEFGFMPNYSNEKFEFEANYSSQNNNTWSNKNNIGISTFNLPFYGNIHFKRGLQIHPFIGVGITYKALLSYKDEIIGTIDYGSLGLTEYEEYYEGNRFVVFTDGNMTGEYELDKELYNKGAFGYFFNAGAIYSVSNKLEIRVNLVWNSTFGDIENKGIAKYKNIENGVVDDIYTWENAKYKRLISSNFYGYPDFAPGPRPSTTIRNIGIQISALINLSETNQVKN